MSGSGLASNSYLYGAADGNPVSVDSVGNLSAKTNYTKVINIGKKVLRTGVVYQLPDAPAAWVTIFARSGNKGNIWIAGYGTHAPQVGVGTPLLEGNPITFPCTNLNQFSLIPEQDGDAVYITAGLVGKDVNITPANDPDLDLTPPSVTSTSPTNAATNQQANVLIVIQMSEAIDSSSVSNTTVTVSPSFTYTATIDSNDNTKIDVIHSSNLALSTTYTITLTTGIKDLAGNALASNYSFSFTTQAAPPPPDTTPPTIVSTSPTYNATINTSTIPSITFSEAMSLNSFNYFNTNVETYPNNQVLTSVTYTLSSDLKTVYLNNLNLSGSSIYTLNCIGQNKGPTDLAGNLLSGSVSNIFFTSSTSSTSTVYNVTGNNWEIIYNGGNTAIKETVANTSSALYQITPTNYVLKLKKTGSPSGNVTLKIINNDASTFTTKRTVGTIATSSIGTSETAITISDSANTYQLGTNDQISIEYTSGNSSNYISVKTSNVDAFDGSNTYMSKTNSNGNNADYTSNDVAMQIDGF